MKEVTGIMVYYYFVCKRKLWYFYNNINMEQNSELVEIGKIIDNSSYKRENKNIIIDNTIQIDFIDEKNVVLNEVKKSKSLQEEGEWQLKYYIYYLENKGVQNVKGMINYPLLKEKKEVLLSKEDRSILDNTLIEIRELVENEKIPAKINSKICKKCAYYDLCFC